MINCTAIETTSKMRSQEREREREKCVKKVAERSIRLNEHNRSAKNRPAHLQDLPINED